VGCPQSVGGRVELDGTYKLVLMGGAQMLREALFGIVCSFQIYFRRRFQSTSRNRFMFLRDWTETIKTLYGVCHVSFDCIRHRSWGFHMGLSTEDDLNAHYENMKSTWLTL